MRTVVWRPRRQPEQGGGGAFALSGKWLARSLKRLSPFAWMMARTRTKSDFYHLPFIISCFPIPRFPFPHYVMQLYSVEECASGICRIKAMDVRVGSEDGSMYDRLGW